MREPGFRIRPDNGVLAEGPLLDTRSVEYLAERLAAVPGVVAVTLGGSRAVGAAAGSDWDFGLYYRGGLDPADISALGWPGRVFAPGEWGSILNEKRLTERAGLDAIQDRLAQPGPDLGTLVSDVRARLELTDGIWAGG